MPKEKSKNDLAMEGAPPAVMPLPAPMSNFSSYMLVRDAVALLGENGMSKLFDSHVAGTITLVGWRAGTKPTHGPIPVSYFSNPVELDTSTNSIGPDADVAEFRQFERAQQYLDRWQDVQVRRAEIGALKKSLDGRTQSLASAEAKCKVWLVALMAREKTHAKEVYWRTARRKFPGLSGKGFERRWASAAQDAPTWLKAGAPLKKK